MKKWFYILSALLILVIVIFVFIRLENKETGEGVVLQEQKCSLTDTKTSSYQDDGITIQQTVNEHTCPSSLIVSVIKSESDEGEFKSLRNKTAENFLFLKEEVNPDTGDKLVSEYKKGVYYLQDSYTWVNNNAVYIVGINPESRKMSNQIISDSLKSVVDYYLNQYPSTDDLAISKPELTSYNVRERDAQRLRDMHIIPTALQLYNQDKQSYPRGSSLPLGHKNTSCLNLMGWATEGCVNSYFDPIPKDPLDDKAYLYTQLDNGKDYVIQFELEEDFSKYKAGIHTVDSSGIK